MLKGLTAVVTGAAGDLGNAMARQLAENGAHFVMWDIVPRAEKRPNSFQHNFNLQQGSSGFHTH